MAISDFIGGIEKLGALVTPEGSNLAAEFTKRDTEFLTGVTGKETKTTELTNNICEHLKEEGRPGSAEYMDTFAKSTQLDRQVSLFEQGLLDTSNMERDGLPLLIDPIHTNSEMLKDGRVILMPGVRSEFIQTTNTLKYKLDRHINDSARAASEHYTQLLVGTPSFQDTIQAALGIKHEPYEIPFKPSEVEIQRLTQLSELNFTTAEEARETFQREILQMMKQRPGMIGLEGVRGFSEALGSLSKELGGNVDGSVNIDRFRHLHKYMTGRGAMEELHIYPGFGDAIKNSVDRDYAPRTQTSASSSKVVEGEIIFHEGEWLKDDIDSETKEWLAGSGHENISEGFSSEEQNTADEFTNELFVEAKEKSSSQQPSDMDPYEALKAVEKSEDDSETMKLLLRVAIKIGTKVAIIIARNIAKDKDTPAELRVALGIFADVAEVGGKFTDKLISGNTKPDLQRDCVNFVKARFSKNKKDEDNQEEEEVGEINS